MSEGGKEAVRADDAVVAASEVRRLRRAGARAGTAARPQNHGSRNPQGGARLGTGKKTDLAVALAACGRYRVKTISGTLGVARSNIIERRDG